jgi:hypothetical protein
VVLVELVVLVPRDFQLERRDPYVRPTWLAHMIADAVPSDARVFATDAKLFPNTAGAYGLQDIRSLDALYPDRYVSYIRSFIQPDFTDRFVGGPFASKEKARGETDDNPMFDLTGVRYVVAAVQQPGDHIVREAFGRTPPSDSVRLARITVDGDMRFALTIRPGAQAAIPIPEGATTLGFASLLDVTDHPEAVRFGGTEAVIRAAEGAEPRLWSRRPAGASDSAQWQESTIDLAGARSISLGVTGTSDSAPTAFADLRFGFGGPPDPKQYRHIVGSDGSDVYENTRRAPRSFVVHDVAPVDGLNGALRFFQGVSQRLPSGALHVNRFDPRRQAVVEARPTDQVAGIRGCAAAGHASIRSYSAEKVVIDADSQCPGLVVLTDMFDPGWRATVNGRRATIHPTDVAFRGIVVGSGRSTIQLRYRPTSFRLGILVALTAALVATALCVLLRLRYRRQTAPTEIVPK